MSTSVGQTFGSSSAHPVTAGRISIKRMQKRFHSLKNTGGHGRCCVEIKVDSPHGDITPEFGGKNKNGIKRRRSRSLPNIKRSK
jgi:hypothetical protein